MFLSTVSLIERVFRSARKQRNWDHFTKAQRKNLDTWLKQAEDIRKAHENDMLRDRHEEAMETSEDDEDDGFDHHSDHGRGPPAAKKQKFDPGTVFHTA